MTTSLNIQVIDHPLVRHKLSLMREKDTSTYKFRTLTNELGRLMAYEASRDFEIETFTMQGWCGEITGEQIKGKTVTVVPILRAGLGMLDGVLDLLPTAKISVVGLQRDEETLEPVPFFEKFVNDIDRRPALIRLAPCLAGCECRAGTPHALSGGKDPLRSEWHVRHCGHGERASGGGGPRHGTWAP